MQRRVLFKLSWIRNQINQGTGTSWLGYEYIKTWSQEKGIKPILKHRWFISTLYNIGLKVPKFGYYQNRNYKDGK